MTAEGFLGFATRTFTPTACPPAAEDTGHQSSVTFFISHGHDRFEGCHYGASMAVAVVEFVLITLQTLHLCN